MIGKKLVARWLWFLLFASMFFARGWSTSTAEALKDSDRRPRPFRVRPAVKGDISRPSKTDNEAAWSRWFAQQVSGTTEYVLGDGSRVDVLTSEAAWEVDFAPKWKEGCSQATLYGLLPNRKKGLVLILRNRADFKLFYLRAAMVCRENDIELVVLYPGKG